MKTTIIRFRIILPVTYIVVLLSTLIWAVKTQDTILGGFTVLLLMPWARWWPDCISAFDRVHQALGGSLPGGIALVSIVAAFNAGLLFVAGAAFDGWFRRTQTA
jgi:hypothetical protein